MLNNQYATKPVCYKNGCQRWSGGRVGGGQPVELGTHLAVCAALLGLAGGVSVLVPDALDVVVVFVPASAFFTCVLPAAFHLKLHGCCARDARGRVVSFDCMRFLSLWLFGFSPLVAFGGVGAVSFCVLFSRLLGFFSSWFCAGLSVSALEPLCM